MSFSTRETTGPELYASDMFDAPEKLEFSLTQESKDLFEKADPNQGFAIVCWRELNTNKVHVCLVPAVNDDKSSPANGTRVGHKEWVYDKNQKIKNPYVVGVPGKPGVIHESATRYLVETGQIPREIAEKHKENMIGGGLWKASASSKRLLYEFRNKSANLNNHSIKWNKKLNLAFYYKTWLADSSHELDKHDFDPLKSGDFHLRRQLPRKITDALYSAIMSQLPNEEKRERECDTTYLNVNEIEEKYKKMLEKLNRDDLTDDMLMQTVYLAASRGDITTMEAALSYITDKSKINLSFSKEDLDHTALTAASTINAVQLLLSNGASVNKNALMHAAEHGKEDIFKLLFKTYKEKSSLEEIKNLDFLKILSLAIKSGSTHIAEEVLQEIKNINLTLEKELLLNLIKENYKTGKSEKVKLILIKELCHNFPEYRDKTDERNELIDKLISLRSFDSIEFLLTESGLESRTSQEYIGKLILSKIKDQDSVEKKAELFNEFLFNLARQGKFNLIFFIIDSIEINNLDYKQKNESIMIALHILSRNEKISSDQQSIIKKWNSYSYKNISQEIFVSIISPENNKEREKAFFSAYEKLYRENNVDELITLFELAAHYRSITFSEEYNEELINLLKKLLTSIKTNEEKTESVKILKIIDIINQLDNDKSKLTPFLMEVIKNQQIEIAKLLLNKKVPLSINSRFNPIEFAVEMNNTELLKIILSSYSENNFDYAFNIINKILSEAATITTDGEADKPKYASMKKSTRDILLNFCKEFALKINENIMASLDFLYISVGADITQEIQESFNKINENLKAIQLSDHEIDQYKKSYFKRLLDNAAKNKSNEIMQCLLDLGYVSRNQALIAAIEKASLESVSYLIPKTSIDEVEKNNLKIDLKTSFSKLFECLREVSSDKLTSMKKDTKGDKLKSKLKEKYKEIFDFLLEKLKINFPSEHLAWLNEWRKEYRQDPGIIILLNQESAEVSPLQATSLFNKMRQEISSNNNVQAETLNQDEPPKKKRN